MGLGSGTFNFDHNPNAIIANASGYTVPSGKFAFMQATVELNGSVTVNGTAVLGKIASNVHLAAASGSTYTVPAGRRFRGHAMTGTTVAATSDLLVNGDTLPGHNPYGVNLDLGPGGTIKNVNNGASDYVRVNGVEESDDLVSSGGFWLKEGTVVAGSGAFKLFVAEYDV